MVRPLYCDICKRQDHHKPDCPEMFFKNRDGTPDRTKPRGVPMQEPKR